MAVLRSGGWRCSVSAARHRAPGESGLRGEVGPPERRAGTADSRVAYRLVGPRATRNGRASSRLAATRRAGVIPAVSHPVDHGLEIIAGDRDRPGAAVAVVSPSQGEQI